MSIFVKLGYVAAKLTLETIERVAKRYQRTAPNPAAEERYRLASRHIASREAPHLPPKHCIFCGVRLSSLNEDEHCPGPGVSGVNP